MRRFQFYDQHEVEQPKNVLHLQSWFDERDRVDRESVPSRIQRDWLNIGSILHSSASLDGTYKDYIRHLLNEYERRALATHRLKSFVVFF